MDGGTCRSNGGKGGETTTESRFKEPEFTFVSFVLDEGILAPVVWDVGPVFCAYCSSFKSSSFQSIFKHLRSNHPRETDAFRTKLRGNAYHKNKIPKKMGWVCRLEERPKLTAVLSGVLSSSAGGNEDDIGFLSGGDEECDGSNGFIKSNKRRSSDDDDNNNQTGKRVCTAVERSKATLPLHTRK